MLTQRSCWPSRPPGASLASCRRKGDPGLGVLRWAAGDRSAGHSPVQGPHSQGSERDRRRCPTSGDGGMEGVGMECGAGAVGDGGVGSDEKGRGPTETAGRRLPELPRQLLCSLCPQADQEGPRGEKEPCPLQIPAVLNFSGFIITFAQLPHVHKF